jgi:hypothetical protein
MQEGWTCLHIASNTGKLDVVESLVEVGGKQLLMQTDYVSQRNQTNKR